MFTGYYTNNQQAIALGEILELDDVLESIETQMLDLEYEYDDLTSQWDAAIRRDASRGYLFHLQNQFLQIHHEFETLEEQLHVMLAEFDALETQIAS